MTKILLVFATEAEANPTANALNAKPVSRHSMSFDGGFLVVTGMGAMAAATHVMHYLPHCDEVWNIGIAGSLHSHIPPGRFTEIASVSKNLSLPYDIDTHSRTLARNSYPDIHLNHTGLRLLTSDYPIHQPHLREQFGLVADLIDMEGYAIAYCCHTTGKPCRLFKLVSDPCMPDGKEMIRKRLRLYAGHLSQRVLELLEQRNQAALSC